MKNKTLIVIYCILFICGLIIGHVIADIDNRWDKDSYINGCLFGATYTIEMKECPSYWQQREGYKQHLKDMGHGEVRKWVQKEDSIFKQLPENEKWIRGSLNSGKNN